MSAIDYLTGYLMAFGALVALARRAREGGSWLVRIRRPGTLACRTRPGSSGSTKPRRLRSSKEAVELAVSSFVPGAR